MEKPDGSETETTLGSRSKVGLKEYKKGKETLTQRRWYLTLIISSGNRRESFHKLCSSDVLSFSYTPRLIYHFLVFECLPCVFLEKKTVGRRDWLSSSVKTYYKTFIQTPCLITFRVSLRHVLPLSRLLSFIFLLVTRLVSEEHRNVSRVRKSIYLNSNLDQRLRTLEELQPVQRFEETRSQIKVIFYFWL